MPGIIPFPAACIGIVPWQRVVAPEFLLYLLQKRCLAVARIACQENSGGAMCKNCREELSVQRCFHIGFSHEVRIQPPGVGVTGRAIAGETAHLPYPRIYLWQYMLCFRSLIDSP